MLRPISAKGITLAFAAFGHCKCTLHHSGRREPYRGHLPSLGE
jgi:hypothetical protein